MVEPTIEQTVEFFRALFTRISEGKPGLVGDDYAWFAAGALMMWLRDPAKKMPSTGGK